MRRLGDFLWFIGRQKIISYCINKAEFDFSYYLCELLVVPDRRTVIYSGFLVDSLGRCQIISSGWRFIVIWTGVSCTAILYQRIHSEPPVGFAVYSNSWLAMWAAASVPSDFDNRLTNPRLNSRTPQNGMEQVVLDSSNTEWTLSTIAPRVCAVRLLLNASDVQYPQSARTTGTETTQQSDTSEPPLKQCWPCECRSSICYVSRHWISQRRMLFKSTNI